MKYRAKPLVVSALQWDGDIEKMNEWLRSLAGPKPTWVFSSRGYITFFGGGDSASCEVGDWVVVYNERGELGVVSESTFMVRFEPVEVANG